MNAQYDGEWVKRVLEGFLLAKVGTLHKQQFDLYEKKARKKKRGVVNLVIALVFLCITLLLYFTTQFQTMYAMVPPIACAFFLGCGITLSEEASDLASEISDMNTLIITNETMLMYVRREPQLTYREVEVMCREICSNDEEQQFFERYVLPYAVIPSDPFEMDT